MDKSIKILHFNKNVDSKLIETEFLEKRLHCDLKSIRSAEEYKKALETDVYDVILSDSDLSLEDVNSALKYAREMTPHTAFILLAAIKSELKKNTDEPVKDFYNIPQTELETLVPTINRVVNESFERQDISCHWG